MDILLQQTIDGIGLGAIYGSLALAIVLIYQATGLVNIAQGEMAMVSAFVAWQLMAWGLPIWPAILITIVLSFAGGAVIEFTLARRVDMESHEAALVLTVGLMLVLNQTAGWIWGSNVRAFDSPFPDRVLNLGAVRIAYSVLGIVLVLLATMLLLYLLLQRTRLGLAMRGVADNHESARLVGIKVGPVLLTGWSIAGALGALAAVMIAPKLFLEPNFMASVMIYGLAAAVLGGLDSPLGAVIGGLIIGVSENLAGTYIDFIGSDLKPLVPFALMMLIFLVKPSGLLGQKQVVRV